MAYLTASQVRDRQRQRVGNVSAFSDAVIDEAVAAFEALIERYRGVAYTPRTVTEFHADGTHGAVLVLSWPFVRGVPTITRDGVAVTDGFTLDAAAGIIYGFARRGHLSVTYSHGLTAPPAEVLRLCALYAALEVKAADAATVDNAFAVISPDGGTERRSTADWDAGRPTGWLSVDRGLNALVDYRSTGLA